MNFLLDTCVISELARQSPDKRVVSWIKMQDPASLFLSSLTIGELQKGIAKRGGDERARALANWLDSVIVREYHQRILSVDNEVARIWGNVCGTAEREGRKRPAVASLIAATALAHEMTLVTRNVNDMAGMGVSIFNPFT